MESLGTQIRNFRITQNLSVERLGQLINGSHEDIRKIEQGNFLLPPWQLVQLAGIMNTDVIKFLLETKRQQIALGYKTDAAEPMRVMRLKKELKQWEQDKPVIRSLSDFNQLTDFLESIVFYSYRLPYAAKERIMPDGKAQLVIDLEQSSSMVIGPHTIPLDLPLNGNFRKIIIRFQPYGLHLLTGIPQHYLLNRILEADYVFGKAIHLLQEKLQSCHSLDEQKTILQGFFITMNLQQDAFRVEEKVIRYLVGHIEEPIARLVNKSGYSAKHLIHLFRSYTGFTPKKSQQIMQFAESIRQISLLPTHHISGVTMNANYFDQSHLVRQFKRFSGFTPSAYLKTGNNCSRMVLLENV